VTLAVLLAEVAAEVPGVDALALPHGGTEYRIHDRPVTVVGADGSASFRLDPAVAAAARRTPDTGESDRGPEWVRFAPAELDAHGIDRARAWFESAARRARAD
jgi:2,4-dienoyl-CoA reductase-like NADH-dependent reductase (Old Yellow Enzyme family)